MNYYVQKEQLYHGVIDFYMVDITRMNNDILNSIIYGDDLGFGIYIHGNKDHKESSDTSIIINQLKNKTIDNYLNETEITYFIMYKLYIKYLF